MLFEESILAASTASSIGLVMLLLIVGLTAMGVEIFILPGFGVAGILGLLSMIGGVIAAWMYYGSFWGGIAVAGTLLLTITMTVVMLRSRALRKRLVLDAQLQHGGGTQAQDLGHLVSKEGETKTDLRPAGIAIIDGKRVDVVSTGGYIEKNTIVKVVEIDGPRVVVAPKN